MNLHNSKNVLDSNIDFNTCLAYIESRQYKQAMTAFNNLGFSGRAEFLDALVSAGYNRELLAISKLWVKNSYTFVG
jgi:hypothetical protein